MAQPTRIFSLDVGMQTVCLAEFREVPGGGLGLFSFDEVQLLVDPAADATRPDQVESAVRELCEKLKVPKNFPVTVILPSQSVFSRFVKLPGSTPEDVTQIIGFEAQQNVPFPTDEVVWDYQIMGAPRESAWEVALVAIKTDQLTEICTAIRKGGLKPLTIDVAPMAIYNAFRYNYPHADGCSLIVDIGSRTTNLIFCEENRLFCRTIPVGGQAITAAVAKEFTQEIPVAEKLKVEKGMVSLGGAYADPEDPIEARLAKVVRNTMTRLHAEIARSISFYKTSQGGKAPAKIYLCGGSVVLPYMSEFFSEKLQSPVEFLNPFCNVTVVEHAVAERVIESAHAISELVGGALRSEGNCPLEINLRPPNIVQELELAKKKPALILALVCLLLAPLSVWLYYLTAEGMVRQADEQVRAQVNQLEEFQKKIAALTQRQKELADVAAPLQLAAAERQAWTSIVDELNKSLPQRFIWVSRIQPMSDSRPVALGEGASFQVAPPPRSGGQQTPAPVPTINALDISGFFLGSPVNPDEARIVDQFVKSLKASPIFLIEDEAKVIVQRTTPNNETWAFGYTLRLPLRTPIALP